MLDTGVPLHMVNFQVTGEDAQPLPGVVNVELSEISPKTSTLSGSGIAGETEEPISGAMGPIEVTINMRTQTDALIQRLTTSAHQLALSGVIELEDPILGVRRFASVKMVIKGRTKTANLGQFVAGGTTDPSLTISANYIRIVQDLVPKFEFDRFAMKYVVNGFDQMTEVRVRLNI